MSDTPSQPPQRSLNPSAWLDSELFWAGLVLLVGLVIYLPNLGVYPLWDPWEPHYTQVAWEMQEHDTWFNPWYRGRDNWWSKPILMLWMLRGSLGMFWDSAGDFLNHEWAARIPFALTAVFGGVLQFDWSRRLFGRKVGVLSALVLITAPQYLVIGRQIMADMPFLVPYSASLGYLAVGLFASGPAGEQQGLLLKRLFRPTRADWPFAAFWALQAVAVLAKGFVPPVLAALVLVAYWVATFRWRDYQELVAGRAWLRYFLVRGGIAVVAGGALAGLALLIGLLGSSARPMPIRQVMLYQALLAGFGGLGILLGLFHDFPPIRHALRLLLRIRAAWGLLLFFAVAAPWFVYMSFKHGWPYWNEWLYYHHLNRAAGTIDKPSNTFDYYIRQVGVGLFPWSGFLVAALWRFLNRCNPWQSLAGRRNLFILFAALFPHLFFSLSGTKFAHYIFPVVPFLAVIVAAALVWLGREGEEQIALAESEPSLGGAVEGGEPPSDVWWQRPGAKGQLLLFTAISLVTFGIIAQDVVIDFRHFLRLFLYYHGRPTPHGYYPNIELQVILFPIGIAMGSLLLFRFVRRWHLATFAAGAVALACYIGWVTMPAMEATYSFKPFVEAYQKMAKPGEEIGQYNDWQQPVRSVIFLFKNRARHLRTAPQTEAFLKRPGRKFVLVDRNQLPEIRRLASSAGVKLHVVFDGHPYARMLSDQPNPEDSRQAKGHILSELPDDIQRVNHIFDGKIELVGWKLSSDRVRPGEKVTVSFYYRCLALMDKSWQIFVHGDRGSGGINRLHLDHYPADDLYPTNEWQVGEIVRDTFDVEIPRSYPLGVLTLWNGWYIGGGRMPIEDRAAFDDRLRGPRIQVVD